MNIDWFTFAAQIVNFIILLVVLRIFLFKRIIRVIDRRQEQIQEQYRDAERREQEAKRKEEEFREKQRKIEADQDERMEKARQEVSRRRREMMDEARDQVAREREQWFRSLREQQESFLRDLKVRMGREIAGTIRDMMRDLASRELDESIADSFLDRIEHPGDEEQQELARLARKEGRDAVVRSSFEIPEERRKQFTAVLRKQVKDDLRVRFETDRDLIAGIEVSLDGEKIAWSVAGYLSGFEERIADEMSRIDQESGPGHNGSGREHERQTAG